MEAVKLTLAGLQCSPAGTQAWAISGSNSEVRDRLASLGSKKETYNAILKRLVERLERQDDSFKTALVGSNGMASIGRPYAGKTVEWRTKE